jgi:cytosine/adenosine deaminase-related metal-dependent hydrolase
VFPVAAPPVEDAIVVVESGRIVRVGRQAPAGAEVRDLGDVALFPGFVNSHCHLEFSGLKKPLGRHGVSLPKWIRQVIEKRPTPKAMGKAIAHGLEESLRHGVTTIGEIARTETEAYRIDGPAPRLVLFQESIGFSQARAGSALAAAEGRLVELEAFAYGAANGLSMAEAADDHFDDGGPLNSKSKSAKSAPKNGSHKPPGKNGSNGHAHDADRLTGALPGRVRVGVSPHAPYTASPQLIRELVSLAATRRMPVALHLAESPEELLLLAEGRGPFQEILEERGMWDPWVIGRGSSPLDYLRMLTRAPKSLVVHGNYLDHAALAMMARHAGAMSLVYCPRTHAHFGHTRYPLAEALALGVPVALGTDSLASSPDLSLLAEMREAAARHPHVSPEAILRMGTLSGAEAMGLDDVGAIRLGAHADLVTVPLPGGATGRPDELLASILASDDPVDSVWIAGEELALASV